MSTSRGRPRYSCLCVPLPRGIGSLFIVGPRPFANELQYREAERLESLLPSSIPQLTLGSLQLVIDSNSLSMKSWQEHRRLTALSLSTLRSRSATISWHDSTKS